MKRMISWIGIERALELSNKMAAEGLIEITLARFAGRISAEEADRLCYQLGYSAMTVALCHQFGIKGSYN